jgi:hypothetical protein
MVVMEELGPMCDGEIVAFSPTSEIDDGGAQHTSGRQLVGTEGRARLGNSIV